MEEFGVRSMKKMIKSETNKRVSEDAAIELGKLVEHYGMEIAEEARKVADSEDRETVRSSDIVQGLINRGDQ